MYNKTAYGLGANSCYIRELAAWGQARAAQIGKENVYDFSIGNPSIPTPPEVDETIRQILSDTPSIAVHGYTSAIGLHKTRKAIADDLNSRYGQTITPEELFIGCGTSQELCAVFLALSAPGGKVLAIAPYFGEYIPFVENAGMELDIVSADVPGFQINFADLEEKLTPNTQALILNSPNNPSGTVYTAETLHKLAALLQKKSEAYGHPIYIVADEPYRELVYDGVEVPYIPAIYPNTIICYSYSKSLSLAGERIGYILVPRQAQDSRELYLAVSGASRAIGHICAPALWQEVIARCAHLRPNMEAYAKNRKALLDGLLELGYEVAKPDGAFYLFVKVPGGDGFAFSEKAKALDLLVVPGEEFGCPGYVRVCYCVTYEKIVKSLPLFAKLI